MMEKLGAPQTHIGLKAIIKEVDEDLDNALTFREFLLIFRWVYYNFILISDPVFFMFQIIVL